jgi:uncharacterized membrane protein
VIRDLGLLVAGTAALWLLAFFPARLFWGDAGVLYSTAAAVLCLVPMAASMLLVVWSRNGTPEARLAAVMGGTGLRMVVVILTAVALFKTVEELNRPGFLISVVIFYLATLTLEVLVLVGRQKSAGGSQTS